MKIYHLTDIHYMSKKYWEGDPFRGPQILDANQTAESEEYLRTVLDLILKNGDADAVVISGDISNNGEAESHKEVVEILHDYKRRGLKIYLTTATHDFGFGKDMSYHFDKEAKRVYDVFRVERECLREMYREFGRDEAIAAHEESMSYVLQLDENVRLFMLNDDGNLKNLDDSEWGYTESEFDWIKNEVKKAVADGQKIIAVTHHPVLTSSPAFSILEPNSTFLKQIDKIEELADEGVRVFLTGHSHIQSVDFLKTQKGHLYDISTGSLSGTPSVYRVIDYDASRDVMDIKTYDVPVPQGFILRGKSTRDFSIENFTGYLEKLFSDADCDYKSFAVTAKDFSVSYKKAMRLRFIVQPLAMFFNKLKLKHLGRWTLKENGMTKEDVAFYGDKKVATTVFDMIYKVFAGDADYKPDTNTYKIFMSTAAVLTSVAKSLRIDLTKILRGYALADVVENMLYNGGLPDNNLTLDLSKTYEKPPREKNYESNKGAGIVAGAAICAVVLSPILIAYALIGWLYSQFYKIFCRKEN